MTKLYLITGFLGAGKTSFLHHLIPLFSGQRIALIVNEFGKTGVDGTLLRDLDVSLTEINNGSIFCTCQAGQFEKALQETAALAPDQIFVEASGLSDPTSIRALLSQPGLAQDLTYAGAICLLDAVRFHKVYKTARVCRMQLAVSDLILLNKADLATREQLDEIHAIVQVQKPGCPVYETTFGRIDPAWLQAMDIPADQDSAAGFHTRDITLQKLLLEISGFDYASLTSFLKFFADDTYRIKGFVRLPEGVFLMDCVGPLVEIKPFSDPIESPDQLVVLYGNGLPARKRIQEACTWYPSCTVQLS